MRERKKKMDEIRSGSDFLERKRERNEIKSQVSGVGPCYIFVFSLGWE